MAKTPEERAAEIVKMDSGTGASDGTWGDRVDVFCVLVDGERIGPFSFTRADAICQSVRKTIARHIEEAIEESRQDFYDEGFRSCLTEYGIDDDPYADG